jgi:molybdate-binding protein/transcriptional regulator with XRE-family HTH domain
MARLAYDMIMPYDGTIMSEPNRLDNRVKDLRQARGWTQEELAEAAGLSRTGVSAIESARLVPSVAAALGIARALGCVVEDLFGPAGEEYTSQFAWLPAAFPCRYWAAEVAGRTLLFPIENGPRGGLLHDGVARRADDVPPKTDIARRTLVIASCDPAAGYLAAIYRRHGGFRMLAFTRSSGEGLSLLERGLIHVAGVHLAAADDPRGNAAAIGGRHSKGNLQLVQVAQWEEGLACLPATRVRSAAAAAKGKLRWVGRSAGAGARRCQDELLGSRRSPRHVARDHRGVVEAIRSGWADVGVCLRLASEEGQLAFLPVGEENYDLCVRGDEMADPRIVALLATIRSAEYRRLLTELPGYRAQRDLGEVERVGGAR